MVYTRWDDDVGDISVRSQVTKQSAQVGRPSQPPASTPTEGLTTTLNYALNNLGSAEDHTTTIEAMLQGPVAAEASSVAPSPNGLVGQVESMLKRLQRLNDRLAVIAETL